jgi:hypothetical protein
VCSDYEKTTQDIAANRNINFNMSDPVQREADYNVETQLDIPRSPEDTAAKDIAICSRSWRWEWFAMFFQFVIVAAALVVTMCPKRLLRARFPLAVMLAIATVVIMVSPDATADDPPRDTCSASARHLTISYTVPVNSKTGV